MVGGGRGGQRSDVVVSASVDATDVARGSDLDPAALAPRNCSAWRQTRAFSRPLGTSEECRETGEKVCRRSASRCNDGRKKSPEYPDLLHSLAGGGG